MTWRPLLYDAIVKIPESQKEELLDFYIRELTESEPDMRKSFGKYTIISCWCVCYRLWVRLDYAVCTRENSFY